MNKGPLDHLGIEGAGPEMRVALDAMKETLPLLKEFEELRAQQRWSKYEALIKVGFTEEQALELCKSL